MKKENEPTDEELLTFQPENIQNILRGQVDKMGDAVLKHLRRHNQSEGVTRALWSPIPVLLKEIGILIDQLEWPKEIK